MTRKRESFPISKELDGSPISPPVIPQADLERAKEKLKPGVKSVFARNWKRATRKPKPDETSKFQLAEPWPFDWEAAFADA